MTRRVSMSVNNRRPIDRRDSNPGRALGGALALAATTALLIIGWHALAVWIGGAV